MASTENTDPFQGGGLNAPLRIKAFAMPTGFCHFTKMPFGLLDTSTSFQRVMDKALVNVHNCAVAYIDDILVLSPS